MKQHCIEKVEDFSVWKCTGEILLYMLIMGGDDSEFRIELDDLSQGVCLKSASEFIGKNRSKIIRSVGVGSDDERHVALDQLKLILDEYLRMRVVR